MARTTKEEVLMDAIEAAQNLVARAFPACEAAFLGGSVVRGEATTTSDLDIVIVTRETQVAYRKSLYASGWPVEVFVYTPASYRAFFASGVQCRRPSLSRMCAEGIILIDREGSAQQIKQEAQALLDQGPEPLSAAEVTQLRYQLTDNLDDFVCSVRPGESFFIAADGLFRVLTKEKMMPLLRLHLCARRKDMRLETDRSTSLALECNQRKDAIRTRKSYESGPLHSNLLPIRFQRAFRHFTESVQEPI